MVKEKYCFLVCCIIVLAGCNLPAERDKAILEDAIRYDSTEKEVQLVSEPSMNDNGKDTFLLHPFDLYKFKKKKGSAQGGGWKGETYFYKPSDKCFFWGYMMFPPVFKGYLGSDIRDTVYMENSFEMTTCRPFGGNERRFASNVTGEIVVEVKAKYNDFDLPELAFVGLDTAEISKRLGSAYFIKDDCMVYPKENKVLVLKVKSKKVEWLKYDVLNRIITKGNVPKSLLTYDE